MAPNNAAQMQRHEFGSMSGHRTQAGVDSGALPVNSGRWSWPWHNV